MAGFMSETSVTTCVKVHIKGPRDSERTIECEWVQEGEHGLHLMGEEMSKDIRNAVGYVPYDSIAFVEEDD